MEKLFEKFDNVDFKNKSRALSMVEIPI